MVSAFYQENADTRAPLAEGTKCKYLSSDKQFIRNKLTCILSKCIQDLKYYL